MYKNIELPSITTLISTVASVVATAMVLRSLSRDLIPQPLLHYFTNKLNSFLAAFTSEITVTIDEYEGLNKNHLFTASELYLSSITTPSTTRQFRVSLPEKEKKIQFLLSGNEQIIDKFDGILIKWTMVQQKFESRYGEFPSTVKTEVKYLVLCFHQEFKDKVVNEYLPYVIAKSNELKEEKKTLKLHTLKDDTHFDMYRSNPWQSVNLDHPSRFETLAMDDEVKDMIVKDLDRFLERREFYRQVGKAWKRGYLLFGPPGTGKSSLIAAMANYLNFDVYDLELTDVRCNSDLRKLVISTGNRSILVVEDIDASIDLSRNEKPKPKPPPPMYPHYDQGPKVTLSGLLNFIDGLWSSCGDERIIIFTTNHKEKLDPALLRPGRMDIHIHMSYCTPCSFKMLISNYLKITDHPLALEAERLIATAKITPADIGEQLLKDDDPDLVLRGLIEFIHRKKESEEAKIENMEVTEEEDVTEEMEERFDKTEGLKQVVKMSNGTCSDVREKILKNGEAVNALKILIQLLEGETETGNVKDSGTSLGSSEVERIVSESGKGKGIKSE